MVGEEADVTVQIKRDLSHRNLDMDYNIPAAFSINKYAIYAYTHGPVTGSGPSVVTLLATTALTHNW